MTSPQIKQLARRLDSLERQARQRKLPTLGFSAIDDGAIQSVDVDGNLQMIIGKQHDGTQTSAVVTGPTPPKTNLPGLTAQPGALRVYWDGTFADPADVAPMDFARVLVYALPLAEYVAPEPLNQGIIVGQISSATGGEISVVLDPSTEYAVYFVAWTQAGKYGPASDVAVATTLAPLQGEPGADGADGLPGPPGADGESLYTWLKYADDAAGTNMSDSPTNKTYIGLAYNKATAVESTNPADYQWALIKGADGTDGLDGADGVSITGTAVTYQVSSSGTVAPTGAWSSSVPATSPGQYLWTRTVTTLSDSTTTTAYSVGAHGTDGADGLPGNDGLDGVGISSTQVTYQVGTSGTSAPTGTWLTTVPATSTGQFLWTRTVTTLTDATSTTSYSVAAHGSPGAPGNDGVDGLDGVGISSTAVTYQVGSSGTTAPTGAWTSTVPATSPGQYLWTRTVTTLTDASTSTAYAVAKHGETGTPGSDGLDGVGIASTAVTYQVSSSGTTAPTGTWTSTIPATTPGQYLWTRTVTTLTDASTSTAYAVAKHGDTGATGSAGRGISSTAVTYQVSSSGTTAPTGTWTSDIPATSPGQYLWTRTVTTYTDSTTSTSYAVAKHGDTGATGAAGRGVSSTDVTYQKSTDGTTPPAGTWTTSIPATVAGDYLWTRIVTTYTDSTTSTAYSVARHGLTGSQGVPGTPGADGQSLYTWVKYATSSTGAGMTDDPTGMSFIGLAYNKTSATESTTPADYTWSRLTQDPDPLAAPGGSPEIRVTGTPSALIIEAGPIDAGTTLDYHVSETDGFTPDSTTLFTSTTSRVLVVNSLPGSNVPLATDGVYYIRVVAHNSIGTAAASAQISGSLDLENVSSVVTESLITGFVLTGQIQVGQILIDADDGIVINQPGGGYILKFPSNGVDPLELTAQILTNKLNVEDNLNVAGNAQLLGEFQMSNGITNPPAAPTIGNYYPSFQMTSALGDGSSDVSGIYHGLIEDTANSENVLTAISYLGSGIRIFNRYSGVVAAYPDPTNGKAWTDNFYAWGGITKLGGFYYIFGQDNDRPVSGSYVDARCFLYKIDATTFDKVGELELWNTSTWGEYRPRLGNDGTGIYLFWINSNKSLRFRRTTASLGSWGSTTAIMDVPARRKLADVHYGDHDGIGSAKWWIGTDGGSDPIWCFNAGASGPTTRSATYDFEGATNGMMGFTYDTGRSQMNSLDRYGKMYRYGKNATDITVIGKYAWLDDDAAGGTHETMPGPTRTQVIKARGYINTSVSSPPDLKNTDTLNTDKANKVAGYYTQDDGSTWRRRVYQADRSLSTSTEAGTFANVLTATSGTFLETDIGATITRADVPTGTTIVQWLSATQVLMSADATAASGGTTTTLTPASPWSTAVGTLADFALGTPKTSNEFLTSTLATPGKISSAATTTDVDGFTEKIALKGDGQFRLGNLSHVRHFGSRKMTGAQNITNSTWTIVNFGSTKEPETGLTWNGTNSRFIANKPGVYLVTMSIQWLRNTTNRRQIAVWKNGASFALNELPSAALDASTATQILVCQVPMVPGDYIDARVWQNSGATIQVNDAADESRHYFSCGFIQT